MDEQPHENTVSEAAAGGCMPTAPPSEQPTSEYKVELETFSGPMDLLLYLIRKEEVDIYDIPIARITEQYLKYIGSMSDLDVNVAGEFVVMAATLLEIKARMMAPDPVIDEAEEEAVDPRLELVRQLMEYRRFKEAALELAERAGMRAERFSRPGERASDTGEHRTGVPKNVSVAGLLEAFARVLVQTGARGPLTLRLEDIPQERLNAELGAKVRAAGRMTFSSVFEGHTDRAMLIGMFFAVLELARQQILRVEQEAPFAEIWLTYVPPDERDAEPRGPATVE